MEEATMMDLSLTPQEQEHLAELAGLCGQSVADYTTALVRRHLPWVVVRVPAKAQEARTVQGGRLHETLTLYEV
jgi:hypothetical protein